MQILGAMVKVLTGLSATMSKLLVIAYINLFLVILIFIILIVLFILVIAILARTGKSSSEDVKYVSKKENNNLDNGNYFAKSKQNRRKVLLTKN